MEFSVEGCKCEHFLEDTEQEIGLQMVFRVAVLQNVWGGIVD